MTVAEQQTTNGPTTSFDELVERVDTIAADLNRTPRLSIIRAFLNEVGIVAARGVLTDAPDRLGNALESLRVAQEAERVAKESYDAVVLESEWSLGDQFVVDKNRTFLVTPCPEGPHRSDDETLGTCTECNGTGELRKSLTADEKRAYVAAAVAKMPAVAKAAADLHDAAEHTAAARDAIEVARARLGVAKRDVDAAIAQLEALCLAIPASMKESA